MAHQRILYDVSYAIRTVLERSGKKFRFHLSKMLCHSYGFEDGPGCESLNDLPGESQRSAGGITCALSRPS